MAVDAGEVTQGQDQQEVAGQEAAPSGQEQREEGIGSWFRGLFDRGARGQAQEPVSDSEPESAPEGDATAEQPAQPQADPEAVRREAQRIADQEFAKREWTWAEKRAQAGDLEPLREMAEKGHGPAQRKLAELGETYELGQARAAELRQQQEAESFNGTMRTVAQTFDEVTIKPLFDGVPQALKDEALEAFNKAGGGMDGRQAIVTTVMKSYPKHLREQFENESLERIQKDDVYRKKVMAVLRGSPEFDEPDMVAAVSAGERDDMNAVLRQAFGVR
jgi:hypothetical protein